MFEAIKVALKYVVEDGAKEHGSDKYFLCFRLNQLRLTVSKGYSCGLRPRDFFWHRLFAAKALIIYLKILGSLSQLIIIN